MSMSNTCEPCAGTGVVKCWSPGGPCEVPNAPGCDTCGACNQCQDEPMSLPDLADLVRETTEEVDTIAEHVDRARRAAGDPGTVLELHALGDHLLRAWGFLRIAQTAADELARAVR